ncbi:MAG: OB-fold nucleic acid binding domain-containing protein, partial [Crocinitomicaceae bacterium]
MSVILNKKNAKTIKLKEVTSKIKEEFMSVNTAVKSIDIRNLKDYVNQEVVLKGWVSNRRSGKDLEFVVMRDGSGFCQAVVAAQNVSASQFESISK